MAMAVQVDIATETRYRTCRRADGLAKRGYRDRRTARWAMRQLQATTPGMTNMNVYRCEQCRLYHVGHRGTP